MKADEIARQLHEDGDCISMECPFCEPEEGAVDEADFRLHEKIDNEGPDESTEA